MHDEAEEETDEVEDDSDDEWRYYNAIRTTEWENGMDVPVEYTVRHIANWDMGVANVVLPELRTRWLGIFEITCECFHNVWYNRSRHHSHVLVNGCVCRSNSIRVRPLPRKKILQSEGL